MHTFYESHKNKIIQGTPLLYNETEFHTQELFINGVMFTYLKVIKDLNGDKIRFLNRDWETGEPLSMFLNFDITEEMLYKVDQTGGIFFNSPQKLNKYFIMRNGVLQTLWNFSLVVKKQFINHLFSPNK